MIEKSQINDDKTLTQTGVTEFAKFNNYKK
jgi:hypothetical protein